MHRTPRRYLKIEDHLTRLQRSNGLRIAAAEAEI